MHMMQGKDEFFTVEIDGKEFIVDFIKYKPNHSDSPSSHICLVCKDCGDGEVKR